MLKQGQLNHHTPEAYTAAGPGNKYYSSVSPGLVVGVYTAYSLMQQFYNNSFYVTGSCYGPTKCWIQYIVGLISDYSTSHIVVNEHAQNTALDWGALILNNTEPTMNQCCFEKKPLDVVKENIVIGCDIVLLFTRCY